VVTERTRRWLCGALDAVFVLLLLGIPGSVVFFWMTWPSHVSIESLPSPEPKLEASDQVETELVWFAPLWERDLAQPMIDPPPSQPEITPRKPDGPVPRLVATLVEAENRYAHLADRKGALRLLQQNESIDGFRVAAIEIDRVQLSRGETVVWLQVPRELE